MLCIKKDWKSTKILQYWINKKEYHKSKKQIDVISVNVDQIVVSNKFNHNYDGFKQFIGYQEGTIVKPLCIILPQMSGYIKYFEYVGQNMSSLIKDDKVQENKFGMWLKISWKLNFIVYLFMI